MRSRPDQPRRLRVDDESQGRHSVELVHDPWTRDNAVAVLRRLIAGATLVQLGQQFVRPPTTTLNTKRLARPRSPEAPAKEPSRRPDSNRGPLHYEGNQSVLSRHLGSRKGWKAATPMDGLCLRRTSLWTPKGPHAEHVTGWHFALRRCRRDLVPEIGRLQLASALTPPLAFRRSAAR